MLELKRRISKIIIDIINNLYKNSLFNNYLIIISLFKFYLLKFLLFQ